MARPSLSLCLAVLRLSSWWLLSSYDLSCVQALNIFPTTINGISRRNAIEFAASSAWVATTTKPSAATTTTTTTLSSLDSSSRSTQAMKEELLALIPAMKYNAPATNATISKEIYETIETLSESIENQAQQSNNAEKSKLLRGNWELLYSNGAEITSLATKLPLGFQLGKTTQPVGDGVFENRGTLEHPYQIAHWQTNVIGDVSIAPPKSLNAIGVVNDRNNRIDVNFRVLVFKIDEVLGKPVQFQKLLVPKPVPEGQAQPANDITYLDETLRIVRGGDGALFIFQRDNTTEQDNYGVSNNLLTTKEREDLLREAKQQGRKGKIDTNNSVDVGIGVAEKSSSPELQFLFQERKMK